jgi:hypothetical protein
MPYGLPDATNEQLARIEQVLRSLEVERAERIKAEGTHAAPPAHAHRSGSDDVRGGVPLRRRRTPGARWRKRPGAHPSGEPVDA